MTILRKPSTRLALALGVSSVALAGCGFFNFSNPDRVAGWEIDEGGFGNPTMQNTQVHNGEIKVLQDLSSRFGGEVPTTINFAFNSARLDAAATSVLREQAAFMRTFPEVRFSVFGHTDEVGSDSANERLGARRAEAVVGFLTQQGISRSRLDALVSFGERQPLIASGTKDRRNRRAVTEVAGFVSDHPLVLDGRYAEIVHRVYQSSAAPGG